MSNAKAKTYVITYPTYLPKALGFESVLFGYWTHMLMNFITLSYFYVKEERFKVMANTNSHVIKLLIVYAIKDN